MLDILLTLNRKRRIVTNFKVCKFVHTILFREAIFFSFFMLPDPTNQIIRHADVKSIVLRLARI